MADPAGLFVLSTRLRGKAVRGKFSGSQRKEFACQFRLGRACPGHPRLETVETKTWIRGSSPRKTTSTRFLGVPHKLTLQGYFPRTALRWRGEGEKLRRRFCPTARCEH